MKVKNIFFSLLLALIFIVFYFNRDDTTFWLFGDRQISKIAILGIFYLLGIISGALIFRRRKRSKKEDTFEKTDEESGSPEGYENERNTDTQLSEEDRDFLGKN